MRSYCRVIYKSLSNRAAHTLDLYKNTQSGMHFYAKYPSRFYRAFSILND